MQTILVLFCIPLILEAQNRDTTRVETHEFIIPNLQRVSVEASIAPFFYGYSGTIDGSLFQFNTSNKIEIGARMGISKWIGGGGGDSRGDDPYAQVVDLLLSASMKSKGTRTSLFLGYTNLKYLYHTYREPANSIKLKMEFDINIFSPIVAVIISVGSASEFTNISLGVSIGYFN